MGSVNKLLIYIVSLVFFASGMFLMQQFINMEERREDYVIEDQAKKSAVELNVSASGGSQLLTAHEVHTSILAQPESLTVMLNGSEITYHARYLANVKGTGISIPDGNYIAYYVYNADGNISSVDYRRL